MHYIISGKVIRGDGYGRKLGFPTVNLEIPQGNPVEAEQGVYSGSATLDHKTYRAGIVIGPANKIEANLIRYDGDAYGKIVTLELHKFLREFKNFETEEELISQIKKDIALC